MVMLSKLRLFKLVASDGRRWKLDDLSIALLENDYPPITHLFFRNMKREQMILPWEAVKAIDWRHDQISVEDLTEAELTSAESLTKEVLLGRDVIECTGS